jgi:hypothetical protein
VRPRDRSQRAARLSTAQAWGRSLRRRLIGLLSADWLPSSVSSFRGFPRSSGRRWAAVCWAAARPHGSSAPWLRPPCAAGGCEVRFTLVRPRGRSPIGRLRSRAFTTGRFMPALLSRRQCETQPDLRFPGDVANGFGQVFEQSLERLADPGGIAVGPGGFSQYPAGAAIAGQAPQGSRRGRGKSYPRR